MAEAKKDKKEKLISLTEAAEISGYARGHLNLLSRSKKLKAKKLGRNWFTTKEWLKKYLNGMNGLRLNGTNGLNGVKEANGTNEVNGREGENGVKGSEGGNGLEGMSGTNGVKRTAGNFFQSFANSLFAPLEVGEIKKEFHSFSISFKNNFKSKKNAIVFSTMFIIAIASGVAAFNGQLTTLDSGLSSVISHQSSVDTRLTTNDGQRVAVVAGQSVERETQDIERGTLSATRTAAGLRIFFSLLIVAFIGFLAFEIFWHLYQKSAGTFSLFFAASIIIFSSLLVHNLIQNKTDANLRTASESANNSVEVAGEGDARKSQIPNPKSQIANSGDYNTAEILSDLHFQKIEVQKGKFPVKSVKTFWKNDDLVFVQGQFLRVANNAITSEKIARHTIKSEDLGTNSVNSRIIKNGSIQGEDIDSDTTITAGEFIGNELTIDNIAVSGTIDLGTNTITDGNFTGDWNFNGGDLTNIGTIASGAITATGHILPGADSVYNLGAGGTEWANLYIDNIIAGTMGLSGDLDMQNNLVLNIGNAGTDFNALGGLTLADDLTVNGNALTATGAALSVDSASVGGGYGAAGVSISNTGNIQANGTLTIDSTSALTGAVTMTNGFDSNAASTVAGLTVDANGNLEVSNGTFTASGGTANINVSSNFNTNINTGTSTGAVNIGNAAANVAVTDGQWSVTSLGAAAFTSVDASAGSGSFDSLTVGGGYGASGVTVSNTGAISADGLIIGSGGLTITGAANLNATGAAATNLGNSTGVLTIASGGASGWTNTSGDLTIQTATFGTMAIDSAGILNLGATSSTAVNLGKAATTLTINPTAWTATPTISGQVTMTSGFDSNAASTVAGLTVDTNGNLTVSNGVTSLSYSGASTALSVTQSGAGYAATIMGGNVGIGTAGPTALLHIVGSLTDIGNVSLYPAAIGDSTNPNRKLLFGYSPDNDAAVIQAVLQGAPNVWKNLSLEPNGGRLGVGTATPLTKLDVESPGGGDIITFGSGRIDTAIRGVLGYLEDDDTTMWIANKYNSNAARFGIRMKGSASGNEVFSVLGNSHIGVNNTAPTYQLDIADSTTIRGINVSNSTALSYGIYSIGTKYGVYGTDGTTSGYLGYDDTYGLYTANNAFIGGTLTLGGDLTITGNIIPSVNDFYTLGDDTHRWKDIFLGGETLHIGTSTADEYTLGYNTTANRLEFNVNGSGNAEIVFDSNGNVGIGTTGPTSTMHIVDSNAQLRLDVIGTGHGNIDIRKANGTAEALTALINGDEIGSFSTRGYGATGYADHSGSMAWYATENWTDIAQGTVLRFYTTKTGTTGGGYLAGYFDGTGRWNVPGNSYIGGFSGAYVASTGLGVSGNSEFQGGLLVGSTSGNLGVGLTAAAVNKFQINGVSVADSGSSPTGSLLVTNTSSTSLALSLGIDNSGTTNNSWIQSRTTNSTSKAVLLLNPNGGAVGVNYTNAVTPPAGAALLVNGNVGIGTTGPTRKLQIHSASGTGIAITDDASGSTITDGMIIQQSGATSYLWNYENGLLGFATNNTEKLRISAAGGLSLGNSYVGTDPGAGSMIIAGNVGIGLTSRLNRLTLKGAADETDIGGTTTADSTTTIIGVGTTFTTDLGIGDRISFSSDPMSYTTVTAIASDTELTVSLALGDGSSQTINAKHAIYRSEDASGNVVDIINDQGYRGIGTPNPDRKLHVYDTSNSMYGATLKIDSSRADAYSRIMLARQGVELAQMRLYNDSSANVMVRLNPVAYLGVDAGASVGAGFSLTMPPANGLLVEGNVGIGNTAPAALLFVGSGGTPGSAGSGDAYIQNDLEVDGTSYLAGISIGGSIIPSTDDNYDLGDDTLRWANLYLGPDTLHIGTSTADEYTIAYDTTNNRLGFNVNGTGNPEVVFDSNGNVGIGTTSPTGILHLSTSGADNNFFQDSFGGQNNIIGRRANGVVGTPTAILANNTMLQLSGRGHNGTSMGSGSKAYAQFNAAQDWSATANGTYIRFFTTGNDTTTASERLRIDQSGNVGIGTTSPGSYVAGKLVVEDTTAAGANGITIRSASDGLGLLYFADDSTGIARYKGYVRYDHANNRLELNSNSGAAASNLVLLENGNVGIGTTNPIQKLHIEGQCVTGDSLLTTVDENINQSFKRIDQIKGGEYVLSLNQDTNKLEPHKISKLLDMGVKPVFKMTTESGKTITTTGNHPYLAVKAQIINNKSQINSKFQTQNLVDPKKLTEEYEFGQTRVVWEDSNEENPEVRGDYRVNKKSAFNTDSLAESDSMQYPGLSSIYNTTRNEKYVKSQIADNPRSRGGEGNRTPRSLDDKPGSAPSHPRDKNSIPQNPEVRDDYGSGAEWTKVMYLEKGDEIAVTDLTPTPSSNQGEGVQKTGEVDGMKFEKIKSIEYVGEKQVYDIEVENTHNFVANGIIAHNTYISGNLGIGNTAPAYKLDIADALTTRGINVSNSTALSYGIYAAGTTYGVYGSDGTTSGYLGYNDTYGLYTANNAYVGGTLTMAGGLTITGSIIPSADNQYDLGDDTHRWRDLYLGPNTLHIGTSTADEYTIAYDTTNNRLGFNVNGTGNPEVVFDSNGNVGIGTTEPGGRLSIKSISANKWIYLTTTAGNPEIESAAGLTLKAGTQSFIYGEATFLSLGRIPSGGGYGDVTIKSGNVGIGTTSPGKALDVIGVIRSDSSLWAPWINAASTGSAQNKTVLSMTSAGNNYGTIQVENTKDSNNNGIWSLGYQSNATNAIGTPVLSWTGSGNVGIGTTTPGKTLDVNGTTRLRDSITFGSSDQKGILTWGNASEGMILRGASGMNLYLGADGADKVTITTAGNVGIGNTAPAYKLDIADALTTRGINVSNSTALSYGIYAAGTTYGVYGSDGTTSGYLGYNDTYGLYTANNAYVGGTLTMAGGLTITGSIIPSADNQYDLGDDTHRWRDLYLGPNTLHIGTSTADEYTLAYDTTNNRLGFNVNGSGNPEVVFDASGNVGVGTTNPIQKLHIEGQCVTGDTKLRRRKKKKKGNGVEEDEFEDIRIDQIQDGDEILTMNEMTGELVISKVRRRMDMGIKEIWKITTASGKTIRTTDNHPYFAKNQTHETFRTMKPVKQKSTVFEVDQSNRIEELNKDSFISIADKELAFTIKFPAKEKRLLYELHLLKRKYRKFGWLEFAKAVKVTVELSNFKITDLVIDFEYPGYEGLITGWFKQYLPGVSVIFTQIGKKSPAHTAAWLAHKQRSSVQAIIQFEQIKNTEAPRGALELLHYGVDTVDSQPTRHSYNNTTKSEKYVKGSDQGQWIKVKDLQNGQEIAVSDEKNGKAVWDKIANIEILPAEQVYDIEVENTHNFVANGIIAHNTYINSNGTDADVKGVEIRQSGAIGGTGYALYATKTGASATNIAGYFSASGGTANYAAIFENGNVGIGTTGPRYKLEVTSSDVVGIYTNKGIQSATNIFSPIVQTPLIYPASAQDLVIQTRTSGSNNIIFKSIGTTPTETMRLDTSGNVGIGTTSPGVVLDVNGTSAILSLDTDGAVGDSSWMKAGGSRAFFGYSGSTANAVVQGGGSKGIEFNVNNSTFGSGQAMVITTSGNVGIGTTGPGSLLQVEKNQNAETAIKLVNTTAGTGAYSALYLSEETSISTKWGGLFHLNGGYTTSGVLQASSTYLDSGDTGGLWLGARNASGKIHFYTAGTGADKERMVIDNTGNVGIGTTSPGSRLQVSQAITGAGTVSLAQFENTNSLSTDQVRVAFIKGSDTGSGINRGMVLWAGSTNSGWGDYENRDLSFYTGAGAAATQKMRLSAAGGLSLGNSYIGTDPGAGNMIINGNVGIGTTSPGYLLEIAKNGTGGGLAIRRTDASPTLFTLLNVGNQMNFAYDGNSFTFNKGISVGSPYSASAPPTDGMIIQGNVGIGTTGPTAKLHIMGSADSSDTPGTGQLKIGLDNPYWTFRESTTPLADLAIDRYYSSAYSEVMRIQRSSGNVGIGTTAPGSRLNVTSAAPSGALSVLRINEAGGTRGDWNFGLNQNVNLYLYPTTDVSGAKFAVSSDSTQATTRFMVNTNSGETWLAPNGGNVGIGTTGPTSQLHIVGSNTTDQIMIENTDAGSASAPDLVLYRNSASPIATDNIGLIQMRGRNSTPADINYVSMLGNIVDPTAGSEDSMLSLFTYAAGVNTETVTLKSGNVGIGTTGPSEKLHVAGDMFVGDGVDLSNFASAWGLTDYIGVVGNVATDIPGIVLGNKDGTENKRFGIYHDTNSDKIVFTNTYSSGGYSDYVFTNGNVGIGTTTVGALLHLSKQTAADTDLRFESQGYNWIMGIDNSDAGKFKISSSTALGTSDRLTIDGNGNVGIGTTTPERRLVVNSDDSSYQFIINRTSASADSALLFKNGGTANWTIGFDQDYGFAINNAAGLGASNELVITSTGNVGIGTTSPLGLLHVGVGTTAPQALVVSATTGNVGIRTGTPATNLHLVGLNRVTDGTTSNLGNLHVHTTDSGAQDIGGSITIGGDNGAPTQRTFGSIEGRKTANGVDSSGYLMFKTNNGGVFGEKMRITSIGNVGIGTTGPLYALDVVGTVYASGKLIAAQNMYVGAGWTIGWSARSQISSSANGLIELTNLAGTDFTRLNFGGTTSSFPAIKRNGATLNFRLADDSADANITAGQITTTGNVGIGTTGPGAKLQVYGLSNADSIIRVTSANTTYDPRLEFSSGSGGWDGLIYVDNPSGNLNLGVGGAGGSSNVITLKYNTGNVGIGTTNPLQKLDVAGEIRYTTEDTDATNNYVCYNTTNKTLSDCTSLRKYKDNIAPLALGLETIMQLNPVTYRVKQNGETTLGFIAEDVEAVNPLLATYDATGQLTGVKMPQLTAVLTKAVQELDSQLTIYNSQLTTHSDEIASLSIQAQNLIVQSQSLVSLQLKTDSDITTLQELQGSVDSNLLVIQGKLDKIDKDNILFQDSVSGEFLKMQKQLDDMLAVQDEQAILSARLGLIESKIDLLNSIIAYDATDKAGIVLGDFKIKGELEIESLKTGDQMSGKYFIKAGETQAEIKTTNASKNSKFYITPLGDPQGRTLYIDLDSVAEGTSFTVKLDGDILDSDIQFNWLIVK